VSFGKIRQQDCRVASCIASDSIVKQLRPSLRASAKQSIEPQRKSGLLPPSLVELRRTRSSRSLSSGAHSRDPLAPRNDVDTASRSRRMFCARYSFISLPSSVRGRGEAGRPMRPIAACANVVVERTRVSQVTPESPGTPRAVVYSLSRALPGDQTWSCHRHRRCLNRRLDASLEASGPHAFAVRLTRHSSKARSTATASPPHVRDDRERPSEWDGMVNHIG
jgi:hypothetical protein